jgi:hypothetical protein
MVLSRYDAQSFRLEVLDAAADVLRAEADRIVFTPTLLLRSSDGENTGWLVGDLADRDAVVNLLALGGLQTAS